MKKNTKMVKYVEDNPYMEIGKEYFIRTVTHYLLGRLIWAGDKELVMEDVSWVADTGRFSEFIEGKTVNENEPFPRGQKVIIGRGAIVDMTQRLIIEKLK